MFQQQLSAQMEATGYGPPILGMALKCYASRQSVATPRDLGLASAKLFSSGRFLAGSSGMCGSSILDVTQQQWVSQLVGA